jgi:tetratricopeptide (TPR) repeat protein
VVAFSRNGKLLASGDSTALLLWITHTATLADMVCEKVWRNLTLDEWRQFVGADLPYERTCPNQPIHPSFVEAGRILASAGDMDGAMAIFQKARELEPSLALDPKAEAKKWAALGLVEKGKEFIVQRKVKEAVAAYAEAQALDQTLKISARSWSELCRSGSLWGHAVEVKHACEQAVALAPGDGGIRDSRGLARALLGDVDGAIADFQAFLAGTGDQEEKDQRQRWIEDLRAGKNPFTPEEIAKLRE